MIPHGLRPDSFGVFVTEGLRSRQRRDSFAFGRVSQCNEDPVIGGIWGILDFRSIRVQIQSVKESESDEING
jgi:hypothetical protein